MTEEECEAMGVGQVGDYQPLDARDVRRKPDEGGRGGAGFAAAQGHTI